MVSKTEALKASAFGAIVVGVVTYVAGSNFVNDVPSLAIIAGITTLAVAYLGMHPN